MSSNPYGTSELFELITKSSNKSFFVHGRILGAKSESLRRVTEGLSGGNTKTIDFSDWDSDTVGRFVEFLYSDTYRYTDPSPERSREELVGEGNNALLVHARLYVLGENSGVKGLKKMALARLRVVLLAVGLHLTQRLSKKAAVDVIGLLAYAYSYTDFSTSSEEPMRSLVLGFVTKNFEKLKLLAWGEIVLLLDEGGVLAVELMDKITNGPHGEGQGSSRPLVANIRRNVSYGACGGPSNGRKPGVSFAPRVSILGERSVSDDEASRRHMSSESSAAGTVGSNMPGYGASSRPMSGSSTASSNMVDFIFNFLFYLIIVVFVLWLFTLY